jgi:plasmid stabilization system protein ParE
MNYELALATQARRHIREQRSWYRLNLEDGESLARRWTRELELALNGLCSQPGRHPPAHAKDQVQPDLVLRRMLFRPWKNGRGWKVIFAIDEVARIVTVLYIRHESRPPLAEEES